MLVREDNDKNPPVHYWVLAATAEARKDAKTTIIPMGLAHHLQEYLIQAANESPNNDYTYKVVEGRRFRCHNIGNDIVIEELLPPKEYGR